MQALQLDYLNSIWGLFSYQLSVISFLGSRQWAVGSGQ